MVVHLLQNSAEKKKFFFENIYFLLNLHYLQKKMFLYGKKSVILKSFFTENKNFYREKYK